MRRCPTNLVVFFFMFLHQDGADNLDMQNKVQLQGGFVWSNYSAMSHGLSWAPISGSV